MTRASAGFGLLSFMLAAAWLVACGGSSSEIAPGTSNPAPDASTPTITSGRTPLPCDVDRVLAERCRSCHGSPPAFGAPIPLVTWEELQAASAADPSTRVYDRVLTKIASDTAPMPPPPNPPLGAAERQVLASWVAAGAPKGTATCDGPAPVDPTPTLGCTANLDLLPASAWEMPAATGDEYICWGVDLTRPTPTHIVGLAPKIDNKDIVHHVVLYESPSSYSSTPTRCSAGGSLSWRMVFAWAPGAQGVELPPEAGFPIAQTGATHYVVQMHYSNPQKLSGKRDASGVSVCTSAPRPNEADVLAFGTQSISIPAVPPPGGVYRRECSITVPSGAPLPLAGLHLFTAMPHMHLLGSEMKTTLTPKAGGPAIDLGGKPAFDFQTQSWIPIQAVTAAGDVITTTCGWKNTTGIPVSFGEKTADEMCYSFTMYWPKVKSSLWSWATPSLLSNCK